ncbi:hypothetical protein A6I85_06000 [Prescottella equi]|nr:hypothetical protein A6I85_06000 [Prescottella equi]
MSGSVLLLLGVGLDVHDAWGGMGFSVNVMSALTGALFGVPVAAVGLAWFSTTNSDQLRRDEVASLTVEMWEDFASAVIAYSSPAVTRALEESAITVRDAFAEICRIQEEIPASHDQSTGYQRLVLSCGQTDEASALARIDRELASIRSARKHISASIEDEGHDSREWLVIRDKWSRLTSEVRMRRAGEGLGWMDPESDKTLTVRLRASGSPLEAFMHADRRVGEIVDEFGKLVKGGDLRGIVDRFRSQTAGLRFDASMYESVRTSALSVLAEIRDTVVAVGTSKWPPSSRFTRTESNRIGVWDNAAVVVAGLAVVVLGSVGFAIWMVVDGAGPKSSTALPPPVATDASVEELGSLATRPQMATNSRGAIELRFGQRAALGCGDTLAMGCDLEFVIGDPVELRQCSSRNQPEAGRLIALPISIDTRLGSDLSRMSGMWDSRGFSVVNASGVTIAAAASSSRSNCAESPKPIPDTIAPASRYEGSIVLDVPDDAAAIQFHPRQSDGGWEWTLR